MKKISKLLFSLVALLSIAVACEPKVDNYVVGDPDVDGCYGVFFQLKDQPVMQSSSRSNSNTIFVINSSGSSHLFEVLTISIFTVSTLSLLMVNRKHWMYRFRSCGVNSLGLYIAIHICFKQWITDPG